MQFPRLASRRLLFCKGGGATTPGLKTPSSRRGPAPSLFAFMAVAVLLMSAGTAAAEAWTTLWSENFADDSDWTLESHWNNDAGPPNDNELSMVPGAETGQWLGPTYRSAVGSLWDDATYDILRIQIDNITFPELGAGQNRQLGWVLADTGANHIPDVADVINDWMDIRLVDATCCAVIAWTLEVKDDGVEQGTQTFTIPQFEDNDRADGLDANITINTLLKRFWINWSTPTNSDSHTGTWTGDGPFAETNSNQLNFWGYSTLAQLFIDDVTLHVNQTAQPAPPPPPPPPRRERIQADFGYATTELGTQFYDRSQGPGENVAWNWSFGDDYGSAREHPFHSFMCKGNYTVSLIVVDEFGNNGSVSAVVQINETKPLCGVVTRGEEGVKVGAGGGVITVPTAVLFIIATISAASLIMGVEIPFFPRKLRLLLLFLSLVMLSFTLGLVGQLTAGIGG